MELPRTIPAKRHNRRGGARQIRKLDSHMGRRGRPQRKKAMKILPVEGKNCDGAKRKKEEKKYMGKTP